MREDILAFWVEEHICGRRVYAILEGIIHPPIEPNRPV
jgi:hypothetical protein